MIRPLRLLLVEDSEDDALLLVRNLRQGGYEVLWERVDMADALHAALEHESWDIVIADYTMPHFSGVAALEILQARGLDLPFIFVSGTIGEDTAVAAMKVGAHDYIMKDNMRRLVPAIGRELREADVRRARKQAEEQIQHLAYYDALTNLPNRTLLYNRFEQAVAIAQRELNPLAFLILDLDRFKDINDALGHRTGDLVLQQVARRLHALLRVSDTAARMGGDEFALLLPSTGREGVEQVAGKVLRAVEEPMAIEALNLDVRTSIGIALCPPHGTEVDILIQRADVAMYVAKEGRSGFCVYEAALDYSSPLRLALASDLRQAISRGELVLHYQPKMSLRQWKVLGVEALVRWNHPKHGLVPPDRFIGLAEQSGLIRPLTLWVIERALQQSKVWRQAGLDLSVAANLSPRNLQDPELPDQIRALLTAAGAAPQSLELEITEGVLMTDAARALQVLGRLHAMGLRLTIDDFGTGYSSLSYLKNLPVHAIKIDKSFLVDLVVHNDDAIVRSATELGHNLGLTVVAEGVESRDTLDRLRAIGCDAVQGTYISSPLNGDDVPRWIREGAPLQESVAHSQRRGRATKRDR